MNGNDTNTIDEKIEQHAEIQQTKQKKLLPYIIIVVCAAIALAAGFFVGKKITKDKEIAAAREYIEWEAQNHTWMEATVDAPKTCSVCGATEGERLKRVNISDWSYDSMDYISKDYLMVSDNGKYFLIDWNGNKVSPDAFGEYDIEKETWSELIKTILWDETAINEYCELHNQALMDGAANGWDYYYCDFQDGSFTVMTYGDDEYPDSFLYDRNLNLIREDSIYTITDYHDGCMMLWAAQEDPIIINSARDLDSAFMCVGEEHSGSSYGLVTGLFETESNGERHNIYNVSEDKLDSAKYNDYLIEFYSPVNKEGWTVGQIAEESDEDIYYGFYNVNTKEVKEWQGTDFSWENHREENGVLCAVIDGRIAIYDKATESYRLYDINKGDYLTGKYKYCEPAYHDYLLCETMDGKWGYLKNSDLSEVGEWHDDASNFCNGYASVIDGGKGHFIDENMQVVSEEFTADVCSTITNDYLDFSDLNGKSVYVAKIGKKCHLVTLE